jgi:hypothetical protein
MNPADPLHPWQRLAGAARRHSDDRDTAAPHGFTTRVVALALGQKRTVSSLFERFAWRAVGIACLLALLSIAVNYSKLGRTVSAEDDQADEDPVAVLLDA